KLTANPLPWLGYPLVGALIGYLFLAEPVGKRFGLNELAAPAAAAGLMALALLVLAWPLNFALKLFFRGFNYVFRKTITGYTRVVDGVIAGHAPVGRLVFIALGGAAA